MMEKAKVLIIAGSDSGGGAGIQGDIKATSANGAYATTAITSITVQNTLGVSQVFDLPLEIIKGQIQAVLEDIGADVIKTGMLSTSEIIKLVAKEFINYKKQNIKALLVVDPVMIAKGGANLLQDSAIESLKKDLLPLSFLATPNIPEAERLSGISITGKEDMIAAAKIILNECKMQNLLIKGGHLEGSKVIDMLFTIDNNNELNFIFEEGEKIDTRNTHGTGCSTASSIAAHLAKGEKLDSAFTKTRNYIYNAIKHAPNIGNGHGPLEHFWNFNI